MITNVKEALKFKSLPTSLWSQAVCHAAWIKNCTFTHSLNLKTTPYQASFNKKPSLATLCLFSCKAYAHTPKINQSKFSECSIECVQIGFAKEKKAYLLYSHACWRLSWSRHVEFEDGEG